MRAHVNLGTCARKHRARRHRDLRNECPKRADIGDTSAAPRRVYQLPNGNWDIERACSQALSGPTIPGALVWRSAMLHPLDCSLSGLAWMFVWLIHTHCICENYDYRFPANIRTQRSPFKSLLRARRGPGIALAGSARAALLRAIQGADPCVRVSGSI